MTEPVDPAAARAAVLALVARRGPASLHGSTEGWSDLAWRDGHWQRRHGSHGEDGVFVEQISEDAAWQALLARAGSAHGCFSPAELATITPQTVWDYYAGIWLR